MPHDDRDDGRGDGRHDRSPRDNRPATGRATDEDTRRSGCDPADGPGADHCGDDRADDSGPPGGPKGWQPSDERVHDVVCEHLSREAALDAGDVTVAVSEGLVTLSGTVADLPTKHAIASLVDRCHGVREIDNRIKVMRGGLPPHPDAPPTPRRWVPRDSPTARDEAEGRHAEPTPDASGRYG